MTVGELRKALDGLPDHIHVCKPCGNDTGCESIENVRFFPQYNIVYVASYWPRFFKEKYIRLYPECRGKELELKQKRLKRLYPKNQENEF